ncbi:MAG: PHB depolymerase family esterase [Actinomycetota bacterium]|nr:PHB depolymerase family esterase [Actinomycetota bacterium]
MPNMHEGMAEATRLTRAGRLNEATALIQRTLGNQTTDGVPNSGAWSSPRAFGTTIPTTAPRIPVPGTSDPGVFRTSASRPTTARTHTPRQTPKRKPEPTTSPSTGRFIAGSHGNEAGTRSYKLYVPSEADEHAGQSLPLVVMLHGCTQNPDDFAAGTGMNALAERGDFFVVYPEQSGSANMQRCWNWFQARDQYRGQGEPSIIAGITREVMATQQVDPRRVYVAGMSAGGAMAATMAATYPDLYAAAGVHSGLAHGAASDMPSAFRAMKQGAPDAAQANLHAPGTTGAADLTRSVPTIVFHGDSDTTVHRRNGEQVLNQWSGAATVAGKATVRKGQASGGRAYTHSVYRDADGRPVAERWIVHGAGHAWSGGDPRGSYTDPQGPDASAEMARFFRQHALEHKSG